MSTTTTTDQSTTSTRPAAVVRRNLEAHARGDVDGWRAGWHDDALWHVTGSSAFVGDIAVDDYAELIRATVNDNSAYTGEPIGLLEVGELAIVTWHSEGSIGEIELDGRGGVLVYRVVGGKVAEGWGIAAGSGGALPF